MDATTAPVLVTGGKTFNDINDDVSRPLENFPTQKWWVVFGTTILILSIWALVVTQFVSRGQGVLGLNSSAGWGTDITNFVFWVGIGHAGTLISAILFLFRQKWQIGRAHV